MKRKRTILIGIVIALAALSVPAYILWDVSYHGPQVVRFNNRCNQIVSDRHLIGQAPDAVKAALGPPTSVITYEDRAGHFTFNYAPHPSFPFAVFQAHFSDGVLNSTELFDD